MPNSPVKKARQERNLTRTQLAQLAGVRYNVVYQAENGLNPTLHKELAAALRNLGHVNIEDEYQRFREEMQKKALEEAKRQE